MLNFLTSFFEHLFGKKEPDFSSKANHVETIKCKNCLKGVPLDKWDCPRCPYCYSYDWRSN